VYMDHPCGPMSAAMTSEGVVAASILKERTLCHSATKETAPETFETATCVVVLQQLYKSHACAVPQSSEPE